jgi:hypothetical protein
MPDPKLQWNCYLVQTQRAVFNPVARLMTLEATVGSWDLSHLTGASYFHVTRQIIQIDTPQSWFMKWFTIKKHNESSNVNTDMTGNHIIQHYFINPFAACDRSHLPLLRCSFHSCIMAPCGCEQCWWYIYSDIKNGVFWDVIPCGSCKNRRFGGT